MIHLNTVLALRLRYIVGLSAIALLVTASFLTMKRVVSQQRGYSGLVSLAGHQAGLSNRIAFFISLMAITDDEAEFAMARAQVGRTINKMRAAHEILRRGAPEGSIPYVVNDNLRTIYEDPKVGLDLALQRFLRRAEQAYESDMNALHTGSAAVLYLTTYGPHILEPMLDAAVDEYEIIGRRAIFKIEKFEWIIWLATLFALLLEVVLIFRPLELQVRKTIKSLEASIAERRRAQTELERSKSLLEATLESTADGILVVDEQGRWSGINKKFLDLWRIPVSMRGGLNGEALKGLLDRVSDPEHFRDTVRRLYRHPDTISSDIIALKDGKILECYSQPQRLGREVVGRVWSFRDVTVQKRIEAELRDSEEFHKELFELSPIALYLQDFSAVAKYAGRLRAGGVEDLEGYLLRHEDELERLLGRVKLQQVNQAGLDLYKAESPAELQRNYRRIIALDDKRHFIRQVAAFTAGRGRYEIEAKCTDFEGHSIDILLRKAVINRAVNGLSKILVSVIDITDLREALIAKSKLEIRLQQVQKMEALGTLAGGMAHDFNNLLMGIQGNASLMLLDDNRGREDANRLRSIEGYIRRGVDLTRQLLGLARGGKYEVKTADLNRLATESATMFGRTRKELCIHHRQQDGIWPVQCDRGQIDQVLLNIFINAWQAMPSGGDLTIRTENTILDEGFVRPHAVPAGRYVQIAITDTGTGMSPETMSKIFDPFFTTKGVGRGTGLGLASVYGIIKNHDGIIEVSSRLGEGSTFRIYLPAVDEPPACEEQSDGRLLRGDERILLVDDEPMVLDIGREMLEAIGYRVVTAPSGTEALEIFRRTGDPIDLVVLDIIMPGMNGTDTFSKMQEIDADIPVLLSSGYSINDQASQMLTRGCRGFIQKPFNIHELSQKLRDVLS